MKVLALGGCGEMGCCAVRTLLEGGLCSGIIIADIDPQRAKAFAAQCGPAAKWLQVDVSDPESLNAALAEVDLVMNTVGPYFKYGEAVIEACIKANLHYIDINDDWEPTLDMLGLHAKAMRAGVTAIIGMGASPGISNMLAVKAMSELDRADRIFTGWDLDSARPEQIGPKPSAAMVHGMHQLTGQIRAFVDGKFCAVKPVQEMKLDYPGVGIHSVWTIGHPETVTLPRYFSDLRYSANVMTTGRSTIFGIKAVGKLVDLGLLSVEKAASIAEKVEGPADPEKTPDAMLDSLKSSEGLGLPPLFALAEGTKDGKPASVAVMVLSAPAGGMGGATGVPLAVGASLIMQGKVSDPGVFAPEGVVDPDDFFNALAPLCTPKKQGVDDLLLVTRSWENPDVLKGLRQRGL